MLAGLKQNGWLNSSPSSFAGSWQSSGAAPCAALMEEVKLEVDLEGAKMVEEPGKCIEDGERLSVSGEEKEARSNADENMDPEECQSGSKNRLASSPIADSSTPSKRMPQMIQNHRGSRLRKKYRGSNAVVSSNSLESGAVCPRQVAAAAKLTAAMAAKTAAKAKAIAADKAAVAAKAAAVAKAALEAIAMVASEEAWKPRRSSTRMHPKASISGEKQRIREVELKQEVQSVKASQMRPPVDDEELARQLHRAMNSSPRISRSRTPLHRQEEDRPSSSPSRRHDRGKHRPGRRRSSSLKDVEKQELRAFRQSFGSSQSHCEEADVKLKSIITLNESSPFDTSLQRRLFSGVDFSDDVASDSAASQDGSWLKKDDLLHANEKQHKRSRKKYIDEDYGLQIDHDGGSIAKSTPASKNDSDLSDSEACFDGISERSAENVSGMDADLSVNKSASLFREGKVSGSRNVKKRRSREKWLSVSGNGMQYVYPERTQENAEKQSILIEERQSSMPQTPTDEVKGGTQNGAWKNVDQVDTDKCNMSDENLGSHEAETSSLSIESDRERKLVQKRRLKDVSAVQNVPKRTCFDSRSKALPKNLTQSAHGRGEGQTWQNEILKGLPKSLPTGKQTLGGSMNLTPFMSAPPMSLRTPTFASGPTGRHS